MLRHRGSWASALLLCLCACGWDPPPTPLWLWYQLVPRLGSNAAELTWQGAAEAAEYIVSVGVEMLNIKAQSRARPVKLHDLYEAAVQTVPAGAVTPPGRGSLRAVLVPSPSRSVAGQPS